MTMEMKMTCNYAQKLEQYTSVGRQLRLYDSDLPDLVYCDRLFYMKKTISKNSSNKGGIQ